MMDKFKAYYSLTKPGVLYGNAITAVAGFLYGSVHNLHFGLFISLLVGSSLIIAAACVLNNVLDQDIDQKMTRTQTRALVAGQAKVGPAIGLTVSLVIVGLIILIAYTNWLVVAIGVIGFIDYVVFYGMLSKRLSIHGTLVGSISGAMPILAGYCAASDRLDIKAILLFLTLFFWQMPEFYSIAIYRLKEYKAAGIPVMSVVKGVVSTRRQIFVYALLFCSSLLLLYPFGHASLIYFLVMLVGSAYFLMKCSLGLKLPVGKLTDAWARSTFHQSLTILLLFCLMISIQGYLPKIG